MKLNIFEKHLKEPYAFQIQSAHYLANGKSIAIRAPTGSGKTESILLPFIEFRNKKLPNRLIYSFPLRALIKDIANRCEKYGETAKINYGGNYEDETWESPFILTTIDQTIANYFCIPFHISRRSGNIPAGAIHTSFLVFDEFHLLEYELGMQVVLKIVERQNETGFPCAILSATLPSKFLEKLEQKGIGIIDVKDEIIKSEKTLVFLENCKIEDKIKEALKRFNKIIVICNTVKRAQDLFISLYPEIKKEVEEAILLHSLFRKEDRERQEDKVLKIFGKNGESKKALLVTTQVIEAGMDISSDVLLTELCPMDSLIQRSGRCARWRGKGEIWVTEVEDAKPYEYNYLNKTREILKNEKELSLTWKKQLELIDKYFENIEFDKVKARAIVINQIEEAFYEKNEEKARKKIQEAIRGKNIDCYIILHTNPECIKNPNYEKINVPFWRVKNWLKDNKVEVYELRESPIIAEGKENWIAKEVKENEISPFKIYVLKPRELYYYPAYGILEKKLKDNYITDFNPLPRTHFLPEFKYKKEEFVEHVKKVLQKAGEILNNEKKTIEIFANDFKLKEEELKRLIVLAVKLHDIGKLNEKWQEKAGWDGKTPLAHTGKENISLPSHAPESARCCFNLFKNLANNREEIYKPIILAIAHHHSIFSNEYKKFKLIKNYKEILSFLGIKEEEINKITNEIKNRSNLGIAVDIISDEFSLYNFVSRIIRLSDRKAMEEV